MKILTLDGGGSKGIYTLGILQEMQKKLGMPLVDYFDCFYGTSTGAIIAAMLVLGRDIEHIKDLYLHRVPHVMKKTTPALRTAELKVMLGQEFGDTKFEDCPKYLGVIASLVNERKPKVFRPFVGRIAGDRTSLFSGHGFTIAEALLSSCAAVPYFEQVRIKSSEGGGNLFLIDGGFLANNPTRCSIDDATRVFNKTEEDLFVVNVGAGTFPRDLKMRHVLSVVN
ncbi:MAG: patatin-like phospholipase family protein, partial [Candidatus Omnitrophica bacterium]|nr:patatin-like phospholipase family protein [Candidatus Omnitrophota bacterium]